MQSIATQFGISREWVRRILKSEKLPTIRHRQKYICTNCGKEFTPPRVSKNLYCSRQCYLDYHHKLHSVTINCSFCGKEKDIKLSLFKRLARIGKTKLIFCDKACRYKYFGKTYDPEKKDKTPYSADELAEMLLPFWTELPEYIKFKCSSCAQFKRGCPRLSLAKKDSQACYRYSHKEKQLPKS